MSLRPVEYKASLNTAKACFKKKANQKIEKVSEGSSGPSPCVQFPVWQKQPLPGVDSKGFNLFLVVKYVYYRKLREYSKAQDRI